MKKLAIRQTAGAVTAALVVALLAATAIPALATHVDPVEVSGNPSCPAGLSEEVKVEPVTSGSTVINQGGSTFTLSWTVTGSTFSWSTTNGLLIGVVVVKGGPNANVYDYRPDGAESDSGLHAPVNPSNGEFYGLSHISFCWDTSDSTTTTSSTPTSSSSSTSSSSTSSSSTSSSSTSSSSTSSSTTSSSTTSSSTTSTPTTSTTTTTTPTDVSPTTTMQATTTTIAPDVEQETTSTTAAPTTTEEETEDTLPFTGIGTDGMAVAALSAMAAGAGLLLLTRNSSERDSR